MILLALCLLGGLLGIFLPETLHQKLPDSMVEARLFGADQVFIFWIRTNWTENCFNLKIFFVYRNSGACQKHQRKGKKRKRTTTQPMNCWNLIKRHECFLIDRKRAVYWQLPRTKMQGNKIGHESIPSYRMGRSKL